MEHIRHYLTIHAPTEKVYDAITSQQGLSDWWTDETLAKPELGFVNEFRFGGDYHKKMRIDKLVPNKEVNWTCELGEEEWIGTHLSFKLESPEEGKTVLRFAHRDWQNATDFYESCNFHWGYFMQSLKMLCEGGEGKPFRDAN